MEKVVSLLKFAGKVWLAIFILGVVGSLVGKWSPSTGNLVADPASASGMLGA